MSGVVFDIETAEAEEMFTYGPGFVRLCGWQDITVDGDPLGDLHISADPARLTAALLAADFVTGHNIIGFDLMSLAVQGFITYGQYERLASGSLDTIITERHLNPVAAKGMQPTGYYGLDATAARYNASGKSTVDFAGKVAILRRIKGDAYADKLIKAQEAVKRRAEAKGTEYKEPAEISVLKVLAAAYGGFGMIDPDDPDYVKYLRLDVTASRGLYRAHRRAFREQSVKSQRYLKNEHGTAAYMGLVTLPGMRVDDALNMARYAEGQARLDAHKRRLHAEHGMPLEGKKPHTTNAGKAAFRAAIAATGIPDHELDEFWPKNKDGSLSTAKDTLTGMAERFAGRNDDAAELCRTILAMNGERSVYGTILAHQVPEPYTLEQRVHPTITPEQSSGRWSMKNPGLTVLGKRGGKARERAVLLADTDDEVLVAIDADQVDARVIAAECQDAEYMKLFQPGMDLHSEVAFRVWPNASDHGLDCDGPGSGKPVKCRCIRRDQAKVFGHGFSYGLGANGMARQHGVDVTVAQGFVSGMTEAFPRLAEWKEEVRSAAGALGFDEEVPANELSYRILSTWAGRPVRVERQRAYTQATALIGQGGTRDVMARAIHRLAGDPQGRGLHRKIRAVVHDEFVVSIPREGAAETAQSMVDLMSFDLKPRPHDAPVRITFGVSDLCCCWGGVYGPDYCRKAQVAA